MHLYHGGGRALVGDKLNPTQANDLDDKPDNILNAVYATDMKIAAIKMGVLSCKGVKMASLGIEEGKELDAVIYEGWPQQKYFYVYTMPSATFENRPKGSHQWVSLTSVAPIHVEKLEVRKYIHLVRPALKREYEAHIKKYEKKLNESRGKNWKANSLKERRFKPYKSRTPPSRARGRVR